MARGNLENLGPSCCRQRAAARWNTSSTLRLPLPPLGLERLAADGTRSSVYLAQSAKTGVALKMSPGAA
jgi:hypothetical protein